jgi:hypothetical protein
MKYLIFLPLLAVAQAQEVPAPGVNLTGLYLSQKIKNFLWESFH